MKVTTSLFSFAFLSVILILSIGISNINNVNAQGTENNNTKKQIILKDNIKSSDDYGLETSTDYVTTFTPEKAFDNILLSPQVKNTAWSQRGDAGFTVNLNNQIKEPVCSAEIFTKGPQSQPFLITVGNKSIEGLLDSTIKTVSFAPDCVKNVDQIKFDVKQPFNVWSPIEEIKLYTDEIIPPIDPPVCPPNMHWDANLKKCVENDTNPPLGNGTTFVNSTLSINVSNSTITINADENSKVIANNPGQVNVPVPDQNDDDQEEDDEDGKESSKGAPIKSQEEDDDKN